MVGLVGLLVAAACGSDVAGTTLDEGQAALSFSGGGGEGYCASNPSAACRRGTPLPAKHLALTFDDGPGTRTAALSTWLKEQGIRATFFVRGASLGNDPRALLAGLQADGHLLANHTWNHVDLTAQGDDAIVSELGRLDAVLSPYVTAQHYVFRAPFGAWSARDYTVLHASAMDKYVGPVKWDIGGQMTSRHAADWDCWQDSSGYGVMTSKQCGDRYLQEVADIDRGVVLMHDQDYGDVGNHSLTAGKGNTVDMVKYIVPILLKQGYSFVRVDEIPDIRAALGGGEGSADAGGVPDASACVEGLAWRQTTHANEWWVEFATDGDVVAASLEIVGGGTVVLHESYRKWVGAPSVRIARGKSVVLHARSSTGGESRTRPIGYLVGLTASTACDTAGDAGLPDAAGCTLAATWAQGAGANNWWVEYAIATPGAAIGSASLEIVGGETVPLSRSYDKWVGPTSSRIATGASVVVRAADAVGNRAQTIPFGYLSERSPTTATCRD